MKISEVAQITGLSISNIRFYERKGLIAPERREDSKYRDYTIEDIEIIKKIVLYRKMDLSIEEIQAIIKNDLYDRQVVKAHIEELKRKRDMINNSMDLCEMFVDEDCDFDTDYFLNYVNNEEKQGRIFSKIDELYNELEEFSKGTLLPDNSIVSAYIPDKWRRRISVFLWGLVIVGFPLLAMLDIGDDDFIRILVVWGIWSLFFFVGFIKFRAISNKNDKKSL